MSTEFSNVYDDRQRAAAYSRLEFPGTYYLAFRDLPEIIAAHVVGDSALDFGCGAGRSTRFLLGHGFQHVVGVDIAEHMIEQARGRDPRGDYRLLPDGSLDGIEARSFDLILAAFTFDNIPTGTQKVAILQSLRNLLRKDGRIVCVVSSPEIYVNEWASFTTRDFPDNREASNGDPVQIVMLDVDDRRPVADVLWTESGYRDVFRRSGLELVRVYKPIGSHDEPIRWVSETSIAPWAIHVLSAEK